MKVIDIYCEVVGSHLTLELLTNQCCSRGEGDLKQILGLLADPGAE